MTAALCPICGSNKPGIFLRRSSEHIRDVAPRVSVIDFMAAQWKTAPSAGRVGTVLSQS